MSQSDFGVIDPSTKSGAQLATDLNDWRDALNSLHKGSTRPSYVATGMLWIDDSATPWKLNIYDGTEDVEVGTIDATSAAFVAVDSDKLDGKEIGTSGDAVPILSANNTFSGKTAFGILNKLNPVNAVVTIENLNGRAAQIMSNLNGPGGVSLLLRMDRTDGYLTQFASGTSVVGSITTDGTNTAYNTTSDYRRKTVKGSVEGYWDRIGAVNPISFTWDVGKDANGFLAHEFQEQYPSSVTGQKDATDADGKPVYQSMQASTSEVMADIFSALQDIQERLSQLESKQA